jgi:hypothetical protein
LVCRGLLIRAARAARKVPAPESATQDTQAPAWTGPPYPGLKAFTEAQAPVFFGRGPEIDALVAGLADRQRRFLALVGASGTSKSSLVMAGLLPKLHQGAIPGSRDWVILPRFTPALEGSPLCGLGSALVRGCASIDEPRWSLAERLAASPEVFAELATTALAGKPDWAELVMFVDQFEELVTLVPEAERAPFVRVLERMAEAPRVRILVTLGPTSPTASTPGRHWWTCVMAMGPTFSSSRAFTPCGG